MGNERRSLLTNTARIQAPWIKVTIGEYSFGVFDKKTKSQFKNNEGMYTYYDITYPNYIQRLNVVKVNGQINQYTLTIEYPVRPSDDPNFFEKVFSSVSNTRKIVFSYGDASMPSYIYKNEEAIITAVTQQFSLENSKITYTVKAVSSSVVGLTGNFTFINSGKKKPSDEIKKIFRNNSKYGLKDLFKGMGENNLNALVAGDDKAVELTTKTNISPLDYIIYLVSCMVPAGSTTNNTSKDIYILTIHDDTIYDISYNDTLSNGGPYFKVTKMSYAKEKADAYEIDIGYNTATIVSSFSVTNDENYSIFYDYNEKLSTEKYSRRINNQGQWEDIYCPMFTSGNDSFETRPEDVNWFTKVTKYPISASIKVQGLLRPATLMQYVRLNVIFPGGNKHISSGLYLITKQVDEISENGYHTTLNLTRISG